MLTTETPEQTQELKSIIEQSIEDSIERAFKKHGRSFSNSLFSLKNLIALLLIIVVIIAAGLYIYNKNSINQPVEPVANHDLTLENDGIFGFTVVDFEEPILGESTRTKLLIVEEQEVYVNSTITDTGLLSLGMFNKQQTVTVHGKGQYTIDLTKIAREDISLNEETYELTIRIPHPTLHEVILYPEKTEISDAKKGWLAFGDIKLTTEQNKTFETEAKKKLSYKLNDAERFKEADRFAKLSAYEMYQPIIKAISPAYKVVIEFQQIAE